VTDVATTQRLFFETLFEELDGYLELRGFSKSEKPNLQKFYSDMGSFLEAVDRATQHQGDYDIYFGVCPRSRPEGTKAAITQTRVAWVDIDRDIDTARKAVNALPYRYSALVESGRGIHAYWVMKEPVDLSTPELQADFEGRLRGLAIKLGGDTQACDVTRIMRVPGTKNLKE